MTNREELAARLDALAEDARDDRWRGKGFSRSEWTAKRAWLGAMYAFDFAAQLIRESPVESSQEARRVCTCNAIDTPHGPAPDEKTPGCPVHSPAPAEEARADAERIGTLLRQIDAEARSSWPGHPERSFAEIQRLVRLTLATLEPAPTPTPEEPDHE